MIKAGIIGGAGYTATIPKPKSYSLTVPVMPETKLPMCMKDFTESAIWSLPTNSR